MSNPVANSSSVSRNTPYTVFVNPVAGGRRSIVYLPRVRQVFERLQIPADFVLTQSKEELDAGVREAIARERRLLMAMGGDGTFQGLVNAAFGTNVVLGVLPTGGGNDFAAALGLPEDPVKAAEAVLRGQPRPMDLLRARTADGRERLYVGGGGVGLDAEAARYASGRYSRVPGRFRYIASALRALAGFTGVDVKVEFPESDLPAAETKALLAAVLNTPTYGAGLRVAPEASPEDGRLNVVVIEDRSLLEVLVLLPRLMGSGELRASGVQRLQANAVRLTTNPVCMFHGDGEILGPTPVEIEVVPQAVQVLAPRRV
jgi:diacylglycerol kinase (ATP)